MRGAWQEAAGRAERVELAGPGIGPLTPGAAHPVEARPQGLELGKQRVEQGHPPLLQQPVRLIDCGATLGIDRHGSLDGSVGARVHADPHPRAGDLLAETGRLADELPGGLPRGVIAEPEGRVGRRGLHARVSPSGGLVVGRAAQRGQRRLEDLVLLEPERVDGAEVLGLGLLDLIGEQRLRLVRRPLVEARVVLPEMGRHGAAGIDHRARQGGSGRQMVADGRALQVIRVLHAQRPARRGERHVPGAGPRGRERGIAPEGGQADPGGEPLPERVLGIELADPPGDDSPGEQVVEDGRRAHGPELCPDAALCAVEERAEPGVGTSERHAGLGPEGVDLVGAYLSRGRLGDEGVERLAVPHAGRVRARRAASAARSPR